jgi:alpha-maltose-1-phosphate synthase
MGKRFNFFDERRPDMTIKVGLVTKEWPPHIYGGAGVHVKYLSKALLGLSKEIELSVHCFGESRSDATSHEISADQKSLNPALQALMTDLLISQDLGEVDLVHSHTWYANMAGHFSQLLHGTKHVITAHSLEPDRPWKADQIGGGYQISSWAEKTAYESADAIIAVSQGMRRDVLKAYPNLDPNKVHAILNGINTEQYSPRPDHVLLERHGIFGPYAIFVGRITRQKGLRHLINAWKDVPKDFGLVLAAGSPDEPAIGAEISAAIKELQADRDNVWWFDKMLPQDEIVSLLSSADLFICPSIYEPLGIVNLEAMACETAVLATDVGGIPEVVADKETGELIHYTGDGRVLEASLSKRIPELMSNPTLLEKYGRAGRERAISAFSWDTIARETLSLYQSVLMES